MWWWNGPTIAALIYWQHLLGKRPMVIQYCYCDLEDGSDRVCTPGSKKECESPWVRCPHFQMRREEDNGDS